MSRIALFLAWCGIVGAPAVFAQDHVAVAATTFGYLKRTRISRGSAEGSASGWGVA
jgi:hypothetical protein